ncbi:MAG TPA: zinc-binding alcohol dehydrogenase family protein [Puia sp.]|nr:zinc-binding alcohol dehydrogenase family protein [Puia sp.]
MKAAVIYQPGDPPRYTDVPEPIPQNKDEILVRVKAAAIKHIDKSRASGRHYSGGAPQEGGRIPGGDGICELTDGNRVYGLGVSGMLAEKAVIHRDRMVSVPDGLDDATAAALPNAVIGAAMGLRFRAGMQPGDVVLVNGATGFTGRVAVQIAKYYGAKKIIATGRNRDSLEELKQLGADETISLSQKDDDIRAQLAAIHAKTPIDVVVDYLWGTTAEMILGCFRGDGSFTNKIRYVSIGSMAGDLIQLSAANLRSVDLQLSGSGLGAWSRQQVVLLFKEILPSMFELAAAGKLKVETITTNLKDIAELWDLEVPGGRRVVVKIADS